MASFLRERSAFIRGAVRNPGEDRDGRSLTVRDVPTLAGGLRLEAASNRIDIFRVNIIENQPTTTFVTTLTVDRDYNITSGAAADFQLQPYDQIVVRTVPEFQDRSRSVVTPSSFRRSAISRMRSLSFAFLACQAPPPRRSAHWHDPGASRRDLRLRACGRSPIPRRYSAQKRPTRHRV